MIWSGLRGAVGLALAVYLTGFAEYVKLTVLFLNAYPNFISLALLP